MQKNNHFINSMFYTSLIAVFVWATMEHFDRIIEIGLSGGDEYYYWQVYKDWAMGKITIADYYRPAAYFIHSKLFSIVGINDFAHKILNQLFDLGTLGLMIILSKKYFSGWLPGAIAGLVYLAAPMITHHSRHGVLHPSSAFFVILSVLICMNENKGLKAIAFSFLSGFTLSIAANIHPDLGTVCVPLALWYIYIYFTREDENTWMMIWKIIAFGAGFSSIFIVSFFVFGFQETITAILQNRKIQTPKVPQEPITHLLRIGYHYIRHNTSKFNFYMFSGACLISIYLFAKKRFWIEKIVFIVVICGWYILCCKLFFGRTLIPRLFIPFVPLTIIVWIDLLHRYTQKRKWPIIFMVFPFLILLLSVRLERPTSWYIPGVDEVSFPKRVHQQLEPIIGNDSPYLIVPFLVYHIHKQLEKDAYLNGNGIYLSEANSEDLISLIKSRKIRYVLWGKRAFDQRVFAKNMRKDVNERLKKYYDLVPENYSVENEKTRLLLKLKSLNPKRVYESDDLELFKLNPEISNDT